MLLDQLLLLDDVGRHVENAGLARQRDLGLGLREHLRRRRRQAEQRKYARASASDFPVHKTSSTAAIGLLTGRWQCTNTLVYHRSRRSFGEIRLAIKACHPNEFLTGHFTPFAGPIRSHAR